MIPRWEKEQGVSTANFWTRFRDGCDLFELGVFDRFTVAIIYTVLEIEHSSKVAVYWLKGAQQEDHGKEQRRLFR